MNRFYIEQLSISGGLHKDSVVNFGSGFNLIIGPSNTGKSLIMDCIDYAFGFNPTVNHSSKIVENNNDYEYVTLRLRTSMGGITVKRQIGSKEIEIISSVQNISSQKYSARRNSKKLPPIDDFFLKLLDITGEHQLLSSQKTGKTKALTWRSLLYLFLLKQPDIARESSALLSPAGKMESTYSKAILLYLLTGQDQNDLVKLEDAKIIKEKQKALLAYIDEKMSYLTKRRKAIEEQLSASPQEDMDSILNKIEQNCSKLKEQINQAVVQSKNIMTELYQQNGKLSECNTLARSFEILHQQYQSDIKRLDFIINGSLEFQKVKLSSDLHCPLCGQKVSITDNSTDYLTASAAELTKLKLHIEGLSLAQKNIALQRNHITERINELEKKKTDLQSLVSDNLVPKLNTLQAQLNEKMKTVQLFIELDTISEQEDSYRKDRFEKENTSIEQKKSNSINDYFNWKLMRKFEQKVISILKASKIGGAETAYFNPKTFDININNKPKDSMGGGYCGVLNTIMAYAMTAYIIELDGYAPSFFAADSSLTQFSEAENIQQVRTVKENFVKYLLAHASDRQVIMIEQKKRMPFIPKESTNIHVIEFTGNKQSGRYGLLNDVYNAET